jgi:hypothetical protein
MVDRGERCGESVRCRSLLYSDHPRVKLNLLLCSRHEAMDGAAYYAGSKEQIPWTHACRFDPALSWRLPYALPALPQAHRIAMRFSYRANRAPLLLAAPLEGNRVVPDAWRTHRGLGDTARRCARTGLRWLALFADARGGQLEAAAIDLIGDRALVQGLTDRRIQSLQ